MAKKDETFDFKKAFDELEAINQWFSEDDIDLNIALEKYRRGAEIVKQIRANLKEVENEFKEIKAEIENE
jgi:exodeoxyribonuclease VII small subunit